MAQLWWENKIFEYSFKIFYCSWLCAFLISQMSESWSDHGPCDSGGISGQSVQPSVHFTGEWQVSGISGWTNNISIVLLHSLWTFSGPWHWWIATVKIKLVSLPGTPIWSQITPSEHLATLQSLSETLRKSWSTSYKSFNKSSACLHRSSMSSSSISWAAWSLQEMWVHRYNNAS